MATARPLDDRRRAAGDGRLPAHLGRRPAEADRWLPCRPLVSDPAALAALVATTRAERGTDRDDVATSLFVQGYAFRIATVAIGAWVLSGPCSTSRRTTSRSPSAGAGPTASTSPWPRCRSSAATRWPTSTPGCRRPPRPVRRHGPPLVPGRRRPAVGQRGRVVRVVVRCRRRRPGRPSGEIGDRAEEFFATARPEVRDGGRLVAGRRAVRLGAPQLLPLVRTESAWLCARTARCARPTTTGPATPPCWDGREPARPSSRFAARAAPPPPPRPTGRTPMPEREADDIPTDDPRPTTCAGRRRWCSSTPAPARARPRRRWAS